MGILNSLRLMGLQSKGNPRGIRYHGVDQGTPEWLHMRAGRVTCSQLKRAMGNENAVDAVVDKLVEEKIQGPELNSYRNQAMQDGIDREPLVRKAYARLHGVVTEVGFILNDSIPLMGYSPDGVTAGGKGLIEIKCPTARTMERYLENNELAYQEYFWQLNGGMMVANAEWIDLVIWHPNYDSIILRIDRNRRIDVDIKARLATVQNRFDARMAEIRAAA